MKHESLYSELGLALARHGLSEAGRQQVGQFGRGTAVALFRHLDGAALGRLDGDRKQPHLLDLEKRRRAIRDFQDPLDDFARSPPCFI